MNKMKIIQSAPMEIILDSAGRFSSEEYWILEYSEYYLFHYVSVKILEDSASRLFIFGKLIRIGVRSITIPKQKIFRRGIPPDMRAR